ncbi:hypothetical protein [Dysgonomonas sp. ZJ279]|uniref:hypothetical protein n=1 Tax=Dysgonomonas sp. ZJ279 TaxID=2709796 RepID=UPI001C8723D2|nr:hypothetical protein [Dysgonomonas sp. ZJ279]
MKHYSPFIKKYIKEIQNGEYIIYPDGNQIYKKIGIYYVLITDLSIRSFLFNILSFVDVFIWIKDSNTNIILKEKYFRGWCLPNYKKVNDFIERSIQQLD